MKRLETTTKRIKSEYPTSENRAKLGRTHPMVMRVLNLRKSTKRIKYDRIQLVVAKGQKEVLQSIAKEQGVSLNGYTKQALQAKIKADTGKDIEL